MSLSSPVLEVPQPVEPPTPVAPPEPSPGPRHEGGEPASPAYNEAHEAAFKHSQPARPVDDELPRHPVFPMVLGAAMVLVFGVLIALTLRGSLI